MAVRLGYDVALLGRVYQRFAHRVMQCQRRQVRREPGLPSVRSLATGVRIERVCRYLLRPAFAEDAVVALADGEVRVHF